MRPSVRRRSVWLAVMLLAGATPGPRRVAVAGSSGPAEAADAAQAARDDVVRFVRNYVDARNNGETGPLLDLYSAKAEVSTADMGVITRGREGIRAASDRQSGSQGAERMTLGGIDVSFLGQGYALVVAQVGIDLPAGDGRETLRGALTLVVEKSTGRWRVLHEHDSVQFPQEDAP